MHTSAIIASSRGRHFLHPFLLNSACKTILCYMYRVLIHAATHHLDDSTEPEAVSKKAIIRIALLGLMLNIYSFDIVKCRKKTSLCATSISIQPNYASRRSRRRDTSVCVCLSVCLSVCVCVSVCSSCNCSTVAMRRKLTASIGF